MMRIFVVDAIILEICPLLHELKFLQSMTVSIAGKGISYFSNSRIRSGFIFWKSILHKEYSQNLRPESRLLHYTFEQLLILYYLSSTKYSSQADESTKFIVDLSRD